MDYNKITTDGLHPTANGHQVFANKLDSSTPFVPLGDQIIPCTGISLNSNEIVFENTDITLDKQGNGGAITEHYESPIIKRNKK